MAALSDRQPESVIELRRITADHLSALLEEETAEWRAGLDWDFRASAELVRRFVNMHALTGVALVKGPRATGYAYYVCEEDKGLVGDLYVSREHRTLESENALLGAMLRALWQTAGVQRVEAQLMMLSSAASRPVPYAEWFSRYPRHFLEAPLGPILRLPGRHHPGLAIAPWLEDRQEETARLIAASYQGHIDSQVNDQYRSPAGARRFLTNIVQYPGCGTFFAPASFAAIESSTGLLRGISLASLVAYDVGHITQVCVAPELQGTGLGYELVRRSLLAFAAHGCRAASLTVTTTNAPALRLYRSMGFTNRRDFAAYVWQRPVR